MLDLLTDFIAELRAVGIPVSMVEGLDAMRAVQVIDVADRQGLKATLGATLVKNSRHLPAFETAFEVFFALQRTFPEGAEHESVGQGQQQTESGSGGSSGDEMDLMQSLLEALMAGDLSALMEAARQAVDQLAGMEPGRPVGGTYYLFRTMRRLDMEQLRSELRDGLSEGTDPDSALERRLVDEEVDARLGKLRAEIEAEIRRRLVADRGRESVARTLRQPLAEDLDLMHANRDDLRQLEDVIEPLTRKLAARLARRRRRRREGRLDFRRTMRRSLAAGGVPMEPIFRTPRPHRPEVMLLCDVSGSMATFARFTLQFTYAMSSQFSKLRSFVFIDTVDEVTRHFRPGVDFAEAMIRIATEAEVVWLDGHSDYGNSLERFLENYRSEVTPRTTLIVTGDARNNYRPPRAELLGDLAARARATYWLNPEPRSYWDTGDSVMSRYSPYCDGVFEVRSLRQLEHFVEQMALPGTGIRPAKRAQLRVSTSR